MTVPGLAGFAALQAAELEGLLEGIVGPGVVLGLAIVLLPLLATTAALTLGMSIRGFREDRRREAVHADVRDDLLARLGRGAPDWRGWVDGLSPLEREVAQAEVEEYLTIIAGGDREVLLDLADALGMDRRARSLVESGSTQGRTQGLRLLALLGRPVDPTWLVDHVGDARTEREAAIPVLSIEGTDRNRKLGIELLLAGGPLTGFGVDALYRLIESDPAMAFRRLADVEPADPDLLAQVLMVLGTVQSTDRTVPLLNVVGYLEADEPEVRARACSVLAGYGWRDDVRDAVDVGAIRADPDPRVRSSAYRMLGLWGDNEARHHLLVALAGEADPRALVVLVRQLGRLRGLTGVPTRVVDDAIRTWAAVDGFESERRDPLL